MFFTRRQCGKVDVLVPNNNFNPFLSKFELLTRQEHFIYNLLKGVSRGHELGYAALYHFNVF